LAKGRQSDTEVIMTKSIRNLVLGAASVLALGIGDSAMEANAASAANSTSALPALQTSARSPTADFLRKDDIRWSQVELRDLGLYKGSLDGVLGPETKRALVRFQQINNLDRTAALDAQTWDALIYGGELGQGSSNVQRDTDRAEPAANPSPASGLGK
jgi:peptidoglycan hydrolase-like protein with peptidoglycan-binding domain